MEKFYLIFYLPRWFTFFFKALSLTLKNYNWTILLNGFSWMNTKWSSTSVIFIPLWHLMWRGKKKSKDQHTWISEFFATIFRFLARVERESCCSSRNRVCSASQDYQRSWGVMNCNVNAALCCAIFVKEPHCSQTLANKLSICLWGRKLKKKKILHRHFMVHKSLGPVVK